MFLIDRCLVNKGSYIGTLVDDHDHEGPYIIEDLFTNVIIFRPMFWVILIYIVIIQCNLSKSNLFGTNFSVRNRHLVYKG